MKPGDFWLYCRKHGHLYGDEMDQKGCSWDFTVIGKHEVLPPG